LAETPSMTGQLLMAVLVTSTWPASVLVQARGTDTPAEGGGVVNVFEPEQPVIPSLATPLATNRYVVAEGSPLRTTRAVRLLPLIEPVVLAVPVVVVPLGAISHQVTLVSVALVSAPT
jgi:hypothetical protein